MYYPRNVRDADLNVSEVWRVWQLLRSITATSFLRSSSQVHDGNRCLRRQVRNDERPWVPMQLLLLSRSSSSLEHILRALPMSSLDELQVASGISAFPTTREENRHFQAYHHRDSDKTSCLRIITITIAHEQYEDKCTWFMKYNIPCNSYDNHLQSNLPYTLNVEQPVVALVLCECVCVCNADLHTQTANAVAHSAQLPDMLHTVITSHDLKKKNASVSCWKKWNRQRACDLQQLAVTTCKENALSHCYEIKTYLYTYIGLYILHYNSACV